MKLLALLLLLGVASLTAGKVVNSFSDIPECSKFFIPDPNDQNVPIIPTVLPGEQYKQICQLYKDKYRFATLYDTRHRIPVYSAYTYHKGGKGENDFWKIEPQLDVKHTNENNEMASSNKKEEENLPYENQALNIDYDRSVNTWMYTAGHLYPFSYGHDDDQRHSTYTLTNAAPQKDNSNNQWAKDVESPIQKQIGDHCKPTEHRPAYIVTGVVPGPVWLPITRNKKEKTDGINIPKVFWSAYHCKDEKHTVHSYAYTADQIFKTDKEETTFQSTAMSVTELETKLAEYYGTDKFHLFSTG